jgi:hypothetical protein
VSRTNGTALRGVEVAFALALLVRFLTLRDLPLVDLPQHALQLANWLRLDAADPSVSDLELNLRTPYLLAYPVARALCSLMPILTALKLVLWGSICLQALALRRLCERLGHDPWLGLLGYPLGLGYSFCFGFVAFCAALPLIYLAFAQSWSHRAAPTWRSGAALASTLALLLLAHGVALGFCYAVIGPLVLGGGGSLWRRAWPLSSPFVLALVWLSPGRPNTRLGGDYWGVEAWRLLELPAQLVGIGAADLVSTFLGLLLLVALGLGLGRPRAPLLWTPLAVTLLGYAFFPLMFRGAGPLHPRFSAFLVPALLVACEPRSFEPTIRSRARHALTLSVGVAVLSIFAWRASAYDRETAAFHRLTAGLPPGLAVRPIVFERASHAFPGTPAHLHVPAYYSLSKGGNPGYSFAMYSTSVVRHRPGVRVKMGGGAEWAPERFDAEREAADYDYFIVKSGSDRTRTLFPGPTPRAVLDRHIGEWWGYRRNLLPIARIEASLCAD